jgi:hypothetical protein
MNDKPLGECPQEAKVRPAVKLRTLTTEEVTEIKRLAASRKEPIRLVKRAHVIAYMLADPNLYAKDARLKAGFKSHPLGPECVKRFNEQGVKGLADCRLRPGPTINSCSCPSMPVG